MKGPVIGVIGVEQVALFAGTTSVWAPLKCMAISQFNDSHFMRDTSDVYKVTLISNKIGKTQLFLGYDELA